MGSLSMLAKKTMAIAPMAPLALVVFSSLTHVCIASSNLGLSPCHSARPYLRGCSAKPSRGNGGLISEAWELYGDAKRSQLDAGDTSPLSSRTTNSASSVNSPPPSADNLNRTSSTNLNSIEMSTPPKQLKSSASRKLLGGGSFYLSCNNYKVSGLDCALAFTLCRFTAWTANMTRFALANPFGCERCLTNPTGWCNPTKSPYLYCCTA